MFSVCNKNYKSKYALINDELIHIDNYVNKKDDIIKCNHGHDLIYANGDIRKPYFRHKNINDTNQDYISEWHLEWQSNFSDTEISFPKLDINQIRDRRADVLIKDHNIIIELQHSYIDIEEVNNRKNDYEINKIKILWLIDGNNNIRVSNLDNDRKYLEFTSEYWKYKSFSSYEYIYIDINNEIYKIYPKNVKSNMIDVEKPFNKEDFIKLVNNNSEELHKINVPDQCTLYIKQQGAGNGKTYGLIQQLESEEFKHYKYFVIVTKQHSAKYVIYKEFQDQISKGELKHLNNVNAEEINKKYKISYRNTKNNELCQLIIGTIDSLMCKLGDENYKDIDKFQGYVNSIVDDYLNKTNINTISYGNVNIKLNKEVCLIIDETQDLTINYGKAIIQIMRNKYIDAYIVGDKLQSLMNNENAFTYLIDNDFSYINKNLYPYTNICRRFYNNSLVNFINFIVPFDKYSLPKITPYKEDNDNEKLVEIFSGKDVYANEIDETKINKEVEKIMDYYDEEVNNNNYKPEDFLFVTPFTKKNPLVNAIETAIDMYWNKKYNTKEYNRYAIFHKSEEGNSIDLSESVNSTRLVSIHSSKGDGRNVIFVIGMDEQSLKRFSGNSNNLLYDSLIHVALTRMKKKLYFRVLVNNDDIYQKIAKYTQEYDSENQIKPNLNISKRIKYQDIIDSFKNNSDYELFKDIINKINFTNQEEKNIIDLGHHNIRYSSMKIYLIIKVVNYELNNNHNNIKKQFQAILIEIMNTTIHKTEEWQEYYDILKDKNKLCLLKNNKNYVEYYDIILEYMKKIKLKIKDIINNKTTHFCPLECVIFYYMIQIYDEGIYSDITINELYNIIDIYSKSFNLDIKGHDNCLCQKYFKNVKIIENNKNNITKYLKEHYEQITNINKIYEKFINDYPQINWLMNHKLYFNGNNTDFELKQYFNFIGYNDQNVFLVYIKPQLNNLNYNDVLINSIFDTFILQNILKPSDDDEKPSIKDNYNKFNNKNIKIIIFALDKDNYINIEWNNILDRKILIEKIKDKIINKYIIESKNIYNFYKYYKKQCTCTEERDIIKYIISELKNESYYKEEKMPHYILKFFENIQYEIKKSRISLNIYDDEKTFFKELNNEIIESIDDYLK